MGARPLSTSTIRVPRLQEEPKVLGGWQDRVQEQ